jgi:hypothetical protein
MEVAQQNVRLLAEKNITAKLILLLTVKKLCDYRLSFNMICLFLVPCFLGTFWHFHEYPLKSYTTEVGAYVATKVIYKKGNAVKNHHAKTFIEPLSNSYVRMHFTVNEICLKIVKRKN